MADDQKFSAEAILRSEGADKPVKEGTFLQRTGLVLAAFVGSLATIVTLILIVRWAFYAPPVPVIPSAADATTAKTILDNYKTLQQIVLEPFTTLFDSIVVKVLLPVFTSILGYIFGSHVAGKRTSD